MNANDRPNPRCTADWAKYAAAALNGILSHGGMLIPEEPLSPDFKTNPKLMNLCLIAARIADTMVIARDAHK